MVQFLNMDLKFISSWDHSLDKCSQTQFLEGHSSAQFSSNPNQTHLI